MINNPITKEFNNYISDSNIVCELAMLGIFPNRDNSEWILCEFIVIYNNKKFIVNTQIKEDDYKDAFDAMLKMLKE